MVDINGRVASGYEPVREAFEANFAQHGDVGAAFALYRNGELVVDLWGGSRNADTGDPWQEDTLQLVFSTTKGMTAVAANLLVQRGELDLDAPVAHYWPEFKAAGKESIPVRWLLCHKAGLPVLDTKLSPSDLFAWDPVCDALAAQAPIWEPGTAHGYHAITYGFLVGEVVRRISGRSLGQFFADEVARPLSLQTYIGLPEELEPLAAKLILLSLAERPEADVLDALPDEARKIIEAFLDPDGLTQRALSVTDPQLNFNSREVHAAEIPAANGITTARSVAKMYAALIGEVDGVRLFTPETVEAVRTRQTDGSADRVLFFPTEFGLGFMLSSASFEPLMGDGSFGHPGAGGSLAFAHPETGTAFAYVMNKMDQNLAGDQRTLGLIRAVRECL
jgi:CubicO group peptidase (beta-lactamase class C family)